MFIRFDVIHKRYGQTDRQTDRHTDGHCMTAKTALASHRAVKMMHTVIININKLL